MHAVEMTLRTDNGCRTTTFPYCTLRPRVNTAKSKTRLKILIKIIYFYANNLPTEVSHLAVVVGLSTNDPKDF